MITKQTSRFVFVLVLCCFGFCLWTLPVRKDLEWTRELRRASLLCLEAALVLTLDRYVANERLVLLLEVAGVLAGGRVPV